MITAAQIQALAPALSAADAAGWSADIKQAAAAGDLSTPLRMAHFVASVAVETWAFSKLRESFRYTGALHLANVFPHEVHGLADAQSLLERGEEAIANRVYAGRYGNGDEATGDGWRFRGGGALEQTFRSNYRLVGGVTGMPLEDQPQLLEDRATACKVAAIWWAKRGCNGPADRNDAAGVRRIVNGPALEGLHDVETYLDKLLPAHA